MSYLLSRPAPKPPCGNNGNLSTLLNCGVSEWKLQGGPTDVRQPKGVKAGCPCCHRSTFECWLLDDGPLTFSRVSIIDPTVFHARNGFCCAFGAEKSIFWYPENIRSRPHYPENSREADLSTQQTRSQTPSWLPFPHGNCWRHEGDCRPPFTRSQASFGLKAGWPSWNG